MKETHLLEMMRAIQPHVSGRPKRSVELMIQSIDLLHCFHQYQEPSLSACDVEQDSIDFEAMLTDLQPVCTPPEAELVNLILNFFRSRKIYSAYRTVLQQNLSSVGSSSQGANQVESDGGQYGMYTLDNASFAGESSSSLYENSSQGFSESSNKNIPNNSASQSVSGASLEQMKTGTANNNNAFRSLMENHALQSLLSPAQKENLNQIGNLMQAMNS